MKDKAVEGFKVAKRNKMMSVLQTICNSLSSDNIQKGNSLFWSNRDMGSNEFVKL